LRHLKSTIVHCEWKTGLPLYSDRPVVD
jgi:hypothetical protein